MNAVLLVQLDVDATVKLLAELKEGNGGGGIKKHPLHFTMGITFSEAAHAHAHSLPVGPASDLVDSTLKPVLQVRVFFFFIFYHLTFG